MRLRDAHKMPTVKVNDKSYLFETTLRLHAPYALEGATREHRFHPVRRFRFDWAWADYMLAVEIDGGTWLPRGGRHNTDRDRFKLNLASSLGWIVLRFTPAQLTDSPEEAIELFIAAFIMCKARKLALDIVGNCDKIDV